MTLLPLGFGLLVAGVLVLPLDTLPLTTLASGRTVVGVLALVFGGALLGRVLLA